MVGNHMVPTDWALSDKGFSSHFFGVGAWDCGVELRINREFRDYTEL